VDTKKKTAGGRSDGEDQPYDSNRAGKPRQGSGLGAASATLLAQTSRSDSRSRGGGADGRKTKAFASKPYNTSQASETQNPRPTYTSKFKKYRPSL